MDIKEIKGKYVLKYDQDTTCSQCRELIKEGDKLFVDATGVLHKRKKTIEIEDVCIYHYRCIISDEE